MTPKAAKGVSVTGAPSLPISMKYRRGLKAVYLHMNLQVNSFDDLAIAKTQSID